jgi:hypothetical protein
VITLESLLASKFRIAAWHSRPPKATLGAPPWFDQFPNVLLLIFDVTSRVSINIDLFHPMNLSTLSLQGQESQLPIKSSVISQSWLRNSTFQPGQPFGNHDWMCCCRYRDYCEICWCTSWSYSWTISDFQPVLDKTLPQDMLRAANESISEKIRGLRPSPVTIQMGEGTILHHHCLNHIVSHPDLRLLGSAQNFIAYLDRLITPWLQ